MGIPVQQTVAVSNYILMQKIKRRKKYPLVTMIEPLYRCNLACPGCGKIQYPEETLKKSLTPQQMWDCVEESGTPIVGIVGGEPLIHPKMHEVVAGFVKRKKFVYLNTNAVILKRKLDLYPPSNNLIFSIHLDGLAHIHDKCVAKDGVYDVVIDAIKEAKSRGHRVMTNTTVFKDHPVEELQKFFDEMTKLKIDGMMVAPGYQYEKAPQQDAFMQQQRSIDFFKKALAPQKERKWQFNHSPFYLDFIQGKKDYDCTPWGNPTYTLFGWQRPCYMMADGPNGYAKTFRELMDDTEWSKYGLNSGHPKCHNCRTHCGFEPTAIEDTFSSVGNLFRAAKAAM